MAYSDIALLAVDQDFRGRIAASAASENDHLPMHPLTFADTYQWQVAGAPGFGAAYASAIAGDIERPGNDPSVISDAQILAVVQPIADSLVSGEPPPNP
jgi:hypothetical protein